MKKIILLFALLSTTASWAQTRNNSILQKASRQEQTTDTRLEPFYHGVASGDPLTDKVIIWTRVTPRSSETSLIGKYFVALDTAFTQTVTSGNFSTNADKDFTVKVDVTGLAANTTYYYYFSAYNKNSITGRTKTVPTGSIEHLKFAVVSCSNYEGGYFNAYGRISERNDLDAVIHLGDYIYEYGPDSYTNPFINNTLTGRINEPAKEITDLADYRTRYSLYRLDKDLMHVHQQHPFITVWDDHESANDSYKDGAQNHTEGSEGTWANRKAISKKVYFEWMPIREQVGDKIYRKITYGNLADLIMIDSRLEGRDKYPDNFNDADPAAPNNRKMLGNEQLAWFKNQLSSSTAKWKIIGNQVIFANYNVGFAAPNVTVTSAVANTLHPNVIMSSTSGMNMVTVVGPLFLPSIQATENNFIDNWKTYPVERKQIIDHISTITNVVFITGDSHCSWAFDVVNNPVLYPLAAALNIPQKSSDYVLNTTTGIYSGSKAVEFGTPSISSPNFDEALGAGISAGFEYQINNTVAALGVNYNPHLKYVDLDRHGYFVLDLNSNAAQADFYYSNVTTVVGTETYGGKSGRTIDGQNRITVTTIPGILKATQMIAAPPLPRAYVSVAGVTTAPGTTTTPGVTTTTGIINSEIVVLSLYPNPANDVIYVQLGILGGTQTLVTLHDIEGRLVKKFLNTNSDHGIFNLGLDVKDIKPGNYLIVFVSGDKKVTRKVSIK